MSELNSEDKTHSQGASSDAAACNTVNNVSKELGKKESLEDLLSTLSKQINNSDWLQQNTAEKFAAENPEVAKAYKDAAMKKQEEKGGGDQG